jgi:predicted nucleic acid-binding protein
MSKVVIADSTCLIGLSKIGKLYLLHQLFGRVIIPTAVYHEVVVLGAGRLGAEEVKNADWIETQEVENKLAARAFRLTLGAGEAEAIALAAEREVDFIILDDWKARQVALELSLPVVGTVAVLTKAVEKRLIEELSPVLEELRKAGCRFPLI